eukprot:7270396-Prymnesium_polylepis.1
MKARSIWLYVSCAGALWGGSVGREYGYSPGVGEGGRGVPYRARGGDSERAEEAGEGGGCGAGFGSDKIRGAYWRFGGGVAGLGRPMVSLSGHLEVDEQRRALQRGVDLGSLGHGVREEPAHRIGGPKLTERRSRGAEGSGAGFGLAFGV